MNYEELKQAAMVFDRLRSIRDYVSKDRFAMAANVRFGISDERLVDVMYGMLNMTPKMIGYIARDSEEARKSVWYPKHLPLLPKAIEIAEAAYALKPADYSENRVPKVETDIYRADDRRRYFYSENGIEKVVDICLYSRNDLILLAELLQRQGVKMEGAARHLGYLEGEVKGYTKEKFNYYDGDIYFLFGDPTDHVFYDWYSRGQKAGVYVATEKGWRKLLYTPGRGYLNKNGEIEYVDEKHFYSDYLLEQSGMGFQYIGNINYDIRVLREKKEEKEKED